MTGPGRPVRVHGEMKFSGLKSCRAQMKKFPYGFEQTGVGRPGLGNSTLHYQLQVTGSQLRSPVELFSAGLGIMVCSQLMENLHCRSRTVNSRLTYGYTQCFMINCSSGNSNVTSYCLSSFCNVNSFRNKCQKMNLMHNTFGFFFNYCGFPCKCISVMHIIVDTKLSSLCTPFLRL